MRPLRLVLISCMGLLAGCASDFDPYNQLKDFRVLALRADRPALVPGGRAMLDALTFVPPGETVEYRWSWCPLTAGAERAYECAISEEELQMQLDRVLGEGTVMVPPYALGTTSSVAFAYDLPPAIFSGICDALKMIDLPSFVSAPRCEEYFPVTIRLDAKAGAKEITSIKDLRLLYDDEEPENTNPTLGKVFVGKPGMQRMELLPTATIALARETLYELSVEIPETASEDYLAPAENPMDPPVMKHEQLAITWFTESGGLDNTRTSFIEGEISLETAGLNEWTSPKTVDYPAEKVLFYFVARDERGGIGWTTREVALEAMQ